jgi:tRNA-dihydrouridine synthase
MIYFKGENRGVREFRKHLSWIFKGEKGISKRRDEFFKIDSFKNAIGFIDNI